MRYAVLALSVLLCLGIGFTSGQLTDTGSDWFLQLEKPSFYPPGYLFGVVWTILYIMMGISLFLVIEQTKERLPYILFGTQLVLNFFWTLLFFGLKSIPLAIVDILLLWATLLWTIISFRKYSPPAAYLLAPYLLWVTFATVLTIAIAVIN
jgi:benzodiazapine receptor